MGTASHLALDAQGWLQASQHALQALPEGAEWLHALRAHGAGRLATLAWPTAKHEAWQHTSIAPLRAVSAGRWGAPRLAAERLQEVAQRLASLPAAEARVVFIDGRLSLPASSWQAQPGLTVVPFGEGHSPEHDRRLMAHLDSLAGVGGQPQGPFAALNSAFLQDGIGCIFTPCEATHRPPHLQLVFIDSAQPAAQHAHPRIVLIGEAASQGQVSLHHVALGALPEPGTVPRLTNVLTETFLHPGAQLQHLVMQEEAAPLIHQHMARLHHNAQLQAHLVALGGSWSRHELHVQLQAEGARCALYGASLGRAAAHRDVRVHVHHNAPHTASTQLYKGVFDDRASGVFTGKVWVAKGAFDTQAQQLIRSVLLAPGASAHTRPEMEILADDVACSHGATVGPLDPLATFFLQSRGLSAQAARTLLTYAFLAEALAQLRGPEAAFCAQRLAQRFDFGSLGRDDGPALPPPQAMTDAPLPEAIG